MEGRACRPTKESSTCIFTQLCCLLEHHVLRLFSERARLGGAGRKGLVGSVVWRGGAAMSIGSENRQRGAVVSPALQLVLSVKEGLDIRL